jgi:hypothetical protein
MSNDTQTISEKREAAANLRRKAAVLLEKRLVAQADLCEMAADRLEREIAAMEKPAPDGLWERLKKKIEGG